MSTAIIDHLDGHGIEIIQFEHLLSIGHVNGDLDSSSYSLVVSALLQYLPSSLSAMQTMAGPMCQYTSMTKVSSIDEPALGFDLGIFASTDAFINDLISFMRGWLGRLIDRVVTLLFYMIII